MVGAGDLELGYRPERAGQGKDSHLPATSVGETKELSHFKPESMEWRPRHAGP